MPARPDDFVEICKRRFDELGERERIRGGILFRYLWRDESKDFNYRTGLWLSRFPNNIPNQIELVHDFPFDRECIAAAQNTHVNFRPSIPTWMGLMVQRTEEGSVAIGIPQGILDDYVLLAEDPCVPLKTELERKFGIAILNEA